MSTDWGKVRLEDVLPPLMVKHIPTVRCTCPQYDITSVDEAERTYLPGDPTGCPTHDPASAV